MQKANFLARIKPLSSPLFLLSLAFLLLNDFWWKASFHNVLTGKISDFAGLFAFSWFCFSLIGKNSRAIAFGIGLFFIWWKLSWSSNFIEFWNAHLQFGIQRTIDPSDLIALIVLPIANLSFERKSKIQPWRSGPIFQLSMLVLAIFAFCATSYDGTYQYDKQYKIDKSPEAIASKWNELEAQYHFGNPPISLLNENANKFIDQGNHRIYYHHSNEVVTAYDTVYGEVDDSIFIAEIKPYSEALIDSIYLSPEGLLELKFQVEATDSSIEGHFLQAIFKLKAENGTSNIQLLQIDGLHHPELLKDKEGGANSFLREEFERYFITPIQ